MDDELQEPYANETWRLLCRATVEVVNKIELNARVDDLERYMPFALTRTGDSIADRLSEIRAARRPNKDVLPPELNCFD